MAPALPSPQRSDCPLNAFLEAFGDRWSLLIIRDLLFKGRRLYNEFLEGGERVASNILADRLRRLESAGIIVRRDDEKDARRKIYALTDKGLDLAPVLVEMVLWGARYHKTAAPPDVIRKMTHEREAFLSETRESYSKGLNARTSSIKRRA